MSHWDHASTGLLVAVEAEATGLPSEGDGEGRSGSGGRMGVGREADNQAAASSRLETSETARTAGRRFIGSLISLARLASQGKLQVARDFGSSLQKYLAMAFDFRGELGDGGRLDH